MDPQHVAVHAVEYVCLISLSFARLLMALVHFGPLRSTSGPLRSTSGPLRLRGRAQARWTGPEWTGSGPRPGPLRSSAGPHLVRSTCSSLRSTAAVALVQGSGGCKTERGQPRALSLGHPHRPHSSLSLHHLGEVRFICSESRNKTQQKPGRPVCRGPHTPSRYFAPRRPHAVRRERELSAPDARGGGAPRHASICVPRRRTQQYGTHLTHAPAVSG